MLDLETGVHLEEIEASVLPGDELDRPGRIVVDRLGERDGLFAHLAACRRVEQRRGRFFDHLLVPPLDRTFALAKMNDVPALVAKHLDLDMAWVDDEFFHEHAIVAERGFRLRARARETLEDVAAAMSDAHALAAAASRGLDHDRIADLVGDLGCPLWRFDLAEVTRDRGDLRRVGKFLRFDLVAHGLNGSGIGADEHDSCVGQRDSEGRALGKKAVAWMDRVRTRRLAGRDDLLDHEIGLRRRRRADCDRLVGHLDMQRVLVGFGVDSDGLDAHAARRLDDATGDFAAIGDEDFLEHRLPREDSARLAPGSRFYWNENGA